MRPFSNKAPRPRFDPAAYARSLESRDPAAVAAAVHHQLAMHSPELVRPVTYIGGVAGAVEVVPPAAEAEITMQFLPVPLTDTVELDVK